MSVKVANVLLVLGVASLAGGQINPTTAGPQNQNPTQQNRTQYSNTNTATYTNVAPGQFLPTAIGSFAPLGGLGNAASYRPANYAPAALAPTPIQPGGWGLGSWQAGGAAAAAATRRPAGSMAAAAFGQFGSGMSGPGLMIGQSPIAPVLVSGGSAQPGIAGAGFGPLQTTGVIYPSPLLSSMPGGQGGSTGFASGPQYSMAISGAALQPRSAPQASVLHPTPPMGGFYAAQAAPVRPAQPVGSYATVATGMLTGVVPAEPGWGGMGSVAPLPTDMTAPATSGLGTTYMRYSAHREQARPYWFKLGGGGLGGYMQQPPP